MIVPSQIQIISESRRNSPVAEQTCQHIIVIKSSEGILLGDINDYLESNKAYGQPIRGCYIYKTYARIPLIKNLEKNSIPPSNYTYEEEYFKIGYLDDNISFKEEIPVATEVLSPFGEIHKIISHEIVVGKINLEKIMRKYEHSGNLLDFTLVYPMKSDDFPVVVWAWKDEIEAFFPHLSNKQVKMIKRGIINFVPLEILMDAAPEYFKKEDNDISLFPFK